MGECPKEATLAQFVEGALRGEGASVVERHADACGPCRRALAELAKSGPAPARTAESIHAMRKLALALAPDGDAGVRAGDVIGGKYRIERVLGVGGMGVVVAAHHLLLDDKFAIKLLRLHGVDKPEAAARLLMEARAAVRIKSQHVARVSDVGQLDGGAPYVVMEYLEGVDLQTWLKDHGPMPVETAVDVVLQACEAIAEAHALGIVHRDLKPSNLFCVRRPGGQMFVKVLDFGISKITTPGKAGHDVTRTQAVVGTPSYMSPEQLQSSKGVDARTDVWSLGVVLYELLTLQLPFDADTVSELIIRIATDPTPPVRASRPDVPEALERVLATCLEKERDRRFACVLDLATALQPHGSASSAGAVERIRGNLGSATIAVAAAPRVARVAQTRRESPPLQPPHTAAAWAGREPVRAPRRAAWIGAALALGFLAAGSVIVLEVARRPGAASASSTALVAPPTATALAPAVDAAPATAPVTPTTPESATALAPPLATPGVGPAHAAPSLRLHPVVAPSKRSPRCDPPYTVDDQGRKHFKAECYQ